MCYFCPWPGGVNYQYQIHRFNARPVFYQLCRKPLGDIYKQWELGGVMVVWLEIETWAIGKGSTKWGGCVGKDI
jgi:hypothetical protein